ncbi:MAG: hypothetical protein GX107_08260 [Clostridiales bacterium]|jgi:hypothetical protein|nr:hypothetical protein [Clostridiales bacterium]
MKTTFKFLAAFAVIFSLVFCGGCLDFLKGSTKVLDKNPIENLMASYEELYPQWKSDDAVKKVARAQIVSKTGDNLYFVKVRVVNDSPDSDLTVFGYGYVTAEPVSENTKKLIFFNVEKNVANSTYKSVIQKKGYCTDIQYEVQEPTAKVTPDTIIFIFFSVNDNYYAGGATINDDFTYWEIENHDSKD